MMIGKWAISLTVATAFVGGATAASADSIDPTTIQLTSCHIATGCGPEPFGTVTLTQVGANVNVTVSGPNFTFFAATGTIKGDANSVLFAFNAPSTATIANPVATSSITPVPALTGVTGGSFSVNGNPDFGTFTDAIECLTCNGASNQISSISFTVDGATIAQLTGGNQTNTIFIADVLINGATGVVDASVPAPIVGAGLPGVVLACGGLLGLARRRRQRTV
jgi:hypothetical protein